MTEELRRVRDAAGEGFSDERSPGEVLGAPPATRRPQAVASEPIPGAEPPPPPPDSSGVNAAWRADASPPPFGLRGRLFRLARRLLAPAFEAQVAFNARQVQLDNEILAYVDARFAETHRHYDRVLGITGRHLGEIDERHLMLQEELVGHVHDLVKRIDVVLSEAERGRLSLESALRDLRGRLARIEERLARG